ncbi:MAG: hypothetical protein IH948_00435 [Bacteroidetes bacterium]|nr:hypothetical protein [Bacteroidota bacterium]
MFRRYFLFIGVVIVITLTSGLEKSGLVNTKSVGDTLQYFFVGHPYRANAANNKVDVRIEALNYGKYDRIWLGGDVCSEAMLEYSTVEYIDSIFDLSLPSTQYALGNHDIRNGNMEYYREFTGRESYNVFSARGAVTICMNSQLNPSLCEELNNQFDMIKNVCDTISPNSFLFLIMHSNLFYQLPISKPNNYFHANYQYWNANCSSSDATFANAIYPLLLIAKSKGVTVYCIMGDSGSLNKAYYEPSIDSVHFFASGIYNSKYTDSLEILAKPDKVLIFEHIPAANKMSWRFHDLDSLLNAQ